MLFNGTVPILSSEVRLAIEQSFDPIPVANVGHWLIGNTLLREVEMVQVPVKGEDYERDDRTTTLLPADCT